MNRLNVARCAVTMAVLLAGAFGAPVASAKSAPDSKSQIAFGVDMAKRGLWSEALFRFEQAKLLKPQNVSILNNLAICYEAGGRFEEALATYRDLTVRFPAEPVTEKAWWELGQMYEDLKRWDLAAKSYEELGLHFPKTRFDAWFQAAEIYERRLKDVAKAKSAYAMVPTTSPRS